MSRLFPGERVGKSGKQRKKVIRVYGVDDLASGMEFESQMLAYDIAAGNFPDTATLRYTGASGTVVSMTVKEIKKEAKLNGYCEP
jgi:hypothetical protein